MNDDTKLRSVSTKHFGSMLACSHRACTRVCVLGRRPRGISYYSAAFKPHVGTILESTFGIVHADLQTSPCGLCISSMPVTLGIL